MTQNLTPGASIAQVGTTFAAQSVGAAYTTTTGTITTSTSTVTTGNIGLAGNVTVYIFGTYAGVTVNFEASPDNTNWFSWPMQREQTGAIEVSPALASNAAASWTIDAPGFSFFRVRASAWTSGTANVIISPGSYPITPVVSNIDRKDSSRVSIAWTVSTFVTTAVAEGLLTVTESRDGAATTTFTTKVITSGKRLRIQSIFMSVGSAGSTPAVSRIRVRTRVNTGGAVTTSSPLQHLMGAQSGATAKAEAVTVVEFPDGLEFAGDGTKQIGFTVESPDWVTTTNTPYVNLSIVAFEY